MIQSSEIHPIRFKNGAILGLHDQARTQNNGADLRWIDPVPCQAIYRLLEEGDLLEGRDAVYLPAIDEWWQIGVAYPDLVGSPYDSRSLDPVRRFNK